jgi:quercetin dioxygenase-like cupin family protein
MEEVMPVLSPADAVQHDVHGSRFTAYVAPSLGSAQLCAWQLDVPAGTPGLEHRVSREEVLLVLAGTLQVTVDGIGGQVEQGQVVHVPAGSTLLVATGDRPATAWVTTTAGLVAELPDGTRFEPPWAR